MTAERLGRTSNAAVKKHSAPKNVPMLASSASSVIPVRLTNAPTAEAPNAIEPTMLTQAACQSRDFISMKPTVIVTATTASVALTRNAIEPSAFGAHTNRRWAGTRWASNAAPVLRLKSRVPTNWIAAERKSARADGSSHDRLAGVLLCSSCMAAALVKNQEPTKHRAFVAVALAAEANPGAVPIAKNAEPIMNNQHCRHSITPPIVAAAIAQADNAYVSDSCSSQLSGTRPVARIQPARLLSLLRGCQKPEVAKVSTRLTLAGLTIVASIATLAGHQAPQQFPHVTAGDHAVVLADCESDEAADDNDLAQQEEEQDEEAEQEQFDQDEQMAQQQLQQSLQQMQESEQEAEQQNEQAEQQALMDEQQAAQ